MDKIITDESTTTAHVPRSTLCSHSRRWGPHQAPREPQSPKSRNAYVDIDVDIDLDIR